MATIIVVAILAGCTISLLALGASWVIVRRMQSLGAGPDQEVAGQTPAIDRHSDDS